MRVSNRFVSRLATSRSTSRPRRLIYTTNAIEALNSKIRRAVRTRGHFPSDDAAAKLIYLALNATSAEWKRSVREWHAVRSQLAIMFEDRFPMA
jgi:putative transposase